MADDSQAKRRAQILRRRAAFVGASLSAVAGCAPAAVADSTPPAPPGRNSVTVAIDPPEPNAVAAASSAAEGPSPPRAPTNAGGSGPGAPAAFASASATSTRPTVAVVCLSIIIMPKAHFGFGSHQLDAAGKRLLDEAAAVMRSHPSIRVELQGHGGKSELLHQRTLGKRRADAARNYLVGLGVDPNRLCIKDYADTRPIANPATPAGSPANRRVELRKLEPNQPCTP